MYSFEFKRAINELASLRCIKVVWHLSPTHKKEFNAFLSNQFAINNILKKINNYNFVIFSKISSQLIKLTKQVKKANYNNMFHIILSYCINYITISLQ